ncbi:MAG: S-adenosyl-l-methionine hydroxide adenosyltransferase family protein [Promethearchaeota archaeon]
MTELYQDVVALLTDFGPLGQHYIASMKGVILKINPNIKIIDISHNVSAYSIIEASYLLKSTYKYFPTYSVFIIVVDPGVGSSREILALKTKSNFFFVGPNNGIFFNLFNKKEIKECILVNNENYFIKPVSTTFHGRDIMAPVAAHIVNGVPLRNFGDQFDPDNFKDYHISFEVFEEKKIINCTVQYIDSFGNITTNIPLETETIKATSLKIKEADILKIKLKNQEYEGIYTSHFAKVPKGSFLFLKGSSGFLEISINQGNAAEHIGFKVGDVITIVLQT